MLSTEIPNLVGVQPGGRASSRLGSQPAWRLLSTLVFSVAASRQPSAVSRPVRWPWPRLSKVVANYRRLFPGTSIDNRPQPSIVCATPVPFIVSTRFFECARLLSRCSRLISRCSELLHWHFWGFASTGSLSPNVVAHDRRLIPRLTFDIGDNVRSYEPPTARTRLPRTEPTGPGLARDWAGIRPGLTPDLGAGAGPGSGPDTTPARPGVPALPPKAPSGSGES